MLSYFVFSVSPQFIYIISHAFSLTEMLLKRVLRAHFINRNSIKRPVRTTLCHVTRELSRDFMKKRKNLLRALLFAFKSCSLAVFCVDDLI